MNGDPYRGAPQPADRRVINRSGAAYRPADEPQPARDEPPVSTPRSSGSHHSRRSDGDKKSRKGLFWIIGIVVVVIVAVVIGWLVWSNSTKSSGETGINSSRYQAVFLVNGQIYFGKLASFNDKSFKLTDIYYPQAQNSNGTSTDTSTQNATSGGIQLIRLGDEVHGPESEMFISKDQILYYENLKADSKVAQLIQQNESK